MINVILCGGSGTRLWPLSRKLYPKQFVPLFDGKSLFQKTIERNSALCSNFIYVTSRDLHFMTVDQSDDTGIPGIQQKSSYILEPIGRNTAPAIALACLSCDPDEIILVTPSDHLIRDTDQYAACARDAQSLAKAGYLVTFGIAPSYPETGFGYIEGGGDLTEVTNARVIQAFKEKPDKKTATEYMNSGNYFWNSGMFVFKASVFLKELSTYAPEIYKTCIEAYNALSPWKDYGSPVLPVSLELMKAIPADSIDYAVMEKSSLGAVIRSDFGWNDLGSFDALYDILEKDSNGNTSDVDHVFIDSHNNIVIGAGRLIATIGIEDSIIIDTEDALLISKRGDSQKVKDVVDQLNSSKGTISELTDIHRTAHRPWGTYTVLEESANFKIKRIMVKPGRRLSLQKHMHRSEHWVVVTGTATVEIAGEEQIVRPNESVYIKIGDSHRLTNNGIVPLNIIETQVGQYVGEEDIIRMDDDYER
ncbi:MAG: mannose-1-phosphate guanylyltransferase/mannose-6-phosphate isomerase [Spirochaetes bacterium]|jgi:mannose-1-phosphate guanylyltransferase|nr:mannose-1-phosphate guanylyltransferase/mannose-6-phosphate isomerase [Spirochaetota bacterium]